MSTGVKHLHPEAKKCDVGVYFEANGHGTVRLINSFHFFSITSSMMLCNHNLTCSVSHLNVIGLEKCCSLRFKFILHLLKYDKMTVIYIEVSFILS